MSSIRGQMGYLASLSAGEQSFAVICYATKDEARDVFKPGYFQGHAGAFFDGDLLVTNHLPAKSAMNPNPRGRKVVSMIHKSRAGHISLTHLFELPHDPGELQEVLADGLFSSVEPRYVPSFLEAEEQQAAEKAAQREVAEAAERNPESAPEPPNRARGKLHLKRV